MKYILSIDDNPSIRRSLSTIFFEELHHTIDFVEASDGQEALGVLHFMPIDLIILDNKMPTMDGATFIKKASLKFPNTPIILMPDKLSDHEKNEFLKEHIIAIFEKGMFSIFKFKQFILNQLNLT